MTRPYLRSKPRFLILWIRFQLDQGYEVEPAARVIMLDQAFNRDTNGRLWEEGNGRWVRTPSAARHWKSLTGPSESRCRRKLEWSDYERSLVSPKSPSSLFLPSPVPTRGEDSLCPQARESHIDLLSELGTSRTRHQPFVSTPATFARGLPRR